MSGPVVLNETLVVGADGSISASFAGNAMCTGSITNTGGRWSSTQTNNMSTLTITGTPICAGTVSCMSGMVVVPADCMSVQQGLQAEALQYALGRNNTTLTITTSAGETREYSKSM
jgi:hypothetical protein